MGVWNTKVGVERKGMRANTQASLRDGSKRMKDPSSGKTKQEIEDGRLCASRDAGLGCAVGLSPLTT